MNTDIKNRKDIAAKALKPLTAELAGLIGLDSALDHSICMATEGDVLKSIIFKLPPTPDNDLSSTPLPQIHLNSEDELQKEAIIKKMKPLIFELVIITDRAEVFDYLTELTIAIKMFSEISFGATPSQEDEIPEAPEIMDISQPISSLKPQLASIATMKKTTTTLFTSEGRRLQPSSPELSQPTSPPESYLAPQPKSERFQLATTGIGPAIDESSFIVVSSWLSAPDGSAVAKIMDRSSFSHSSIFFPNSFADFFGLDAEDLGEKPISLTYGGKLYTYRTYVLWGANRETHINWGRKLKSIISELFPREYEAAIKGEKYFNKLGYKPRMHFIKSNNDSSLFKICFSQPQTDPAYLASKNTSTGQMLLPINKKNTSTAVKEKKLYSWFLPGDGKSARKAIDATALRNKFSQVPEEVFDWFGVDDFPIGKKLYIVCQMDKLTFAMNFSKYQEKNKKLAIHLNWDDSFKELLDNTFSDLAEEAASHGGSLNGETTDKPLIRFIKQEGTMFYVEFVPAPTLESPLENKLPAPSTPEKSDESLSESLSENESLAPIAEQAPLPGICTLEDAVSDKSRQALNNFIHQVYRHKGRFMPLYSWRRIIGEDFCLKIIDKTFFYDRSVSISIEMRSFFGVVDLEIGSPKDIQINFQEKEYIMKATRFPRKYEGKRIEDEIKTVWSVELRGVMKYLFTDLAKQLSRKDNKFCYGQMALAAFTKADDNSFNLQIIDPNILQFAAAFFLYNNWTSYSRDQRQLLADKHQIKRSDLRLVEKIMLALPLQKND